MERPCKRKRGRLQWRYMDIVKEEMQRVGGCDWGRYSARPTRKGSSCKKTLFIYIMLQSQELKAHKRCRQELNSCDYCSITYLKELKFCDEYCEKIIGLFIFLFFSQIHTNRWCYLWMALKKRSQLNPIRKLDQVRLFGVLKVHRYLYTKFTVWYIHWLV